VLLVHLYLGGHAKRPGHGSHLNWIDPDADTLLVRKGNLH
jgi:hypothetical protein